MHINVNYSPSYRRSSYVNYTSLCLRLEDLNIMDIHKYAMLDNKYKRYTSNETMKREDKGL